ncbi:MAG: ATP-binding protein [candidate division KSB1 bacterium]|nr:ATP-binding protein [candidate division KSB1 bacterium]
MRELSLNILDIITNSIEAEANRVILHIDEDKVENRLTFRIRDNGRGMSQEFVRQVMDPFVTSRTTRPVGMGLSLLHQLARQARGDLDIRSELGQGTEVSTYLRLHCLNRPPLGDVGGTIVNLVISNLDVHFMYIHTTDYGRLWFDSYWILARAAEQDKTLYDMIHPSLEHIKSRLKDINSKA